METCCTAWNYGSIAQLDRASDQKPTAGACLHVVIPGTAAGGGSNVSGPSDPVMNLVTRHMGLAI